MDRIMPIVIITAFFLLVIILKFNPRISKIEDNYTVSYIMHYTIRCKFGSVIRDWFVLLKYNK